MNILGTIFIVDENHIDVLKQNLSVTPPPGAGANMPGTMLCLDMDETDNMLEVWFPDHCQKATLLCPPPIAMYKEIDGDQEGFIELYNDYLDHDESVQDFMASILLYLRSGGNILLYTPSDLSLDTIWINTLMMFFYTRYGITIGTSAENPSSYDIRYDPEVAAFIYNRGFIDVFDYIISSPGYISPAVQRRLHIDLLPMCGPGENIMDVYNLIQQYNAQYGKIYKPAITFEHNGVM